MTRVQLLDDLKPFCEDAVKDMKFPLEVQQGDTEQTRRAPVLYKMRLPNSKEYKKYAPYIIAQIANSYHRQKEGEMPLFRVVVRLVFCVYSEDEQDGAMMLLNVMDRVQEKLLKSVQVGKYFRLDVDEGLEALPYPDDTAPFFAGEMIGTFVRPGTEREVNFDGFKKVY